MWGGRGTASDEGFQKKPLRCNSGDIDREGEKGLVGNDWGEKGDGPREPSTRDRGGGGKDSTKEYSHMGKKRPDARRY